MVLLKIMKENELVFFNTAHCGLFGVQDDFFEEYLSLDEFLFKNKSSTFPLRAQGDSMAPLILPNDVIIVDRSITPRSGQICVFAYEGNLICKRYIKSNVGIILRSDNRIHRDLVINAEIEVILWGVVRGIARELLQL